MSRVRKHLRVDVRRRGVPDGQAGIPPLRARASDPPAGVAIPMGRAGDSCPPPAAPSGIRAHNRRRARSQSLMNRFLARIALRGAGMDSVRPPAPAADQGFSQLDEVAVEEVRNSEVSGALT